MSSNSGTQRYSSETELITKRDCRIHEILFDQIKFINYISVLIMTAIGFIIKHGKNTPYDSLFLIFIASFIYGVIQFAIILPLITRYEKMTSRFVRKSITKIRWLFCFAGGIAIFVSTLYALCCVIYSLPITAPISFNTLIFPNTTPLIAIIIVFVLFCIVRYLCYARHTVESLMIGSSKRVFCLIFTLSMFYVAIAFDPKNLHSLIQSLPLILWLNAWSLLIICLGFVCK